MPVVKVSNCKLYHIRRENVGCATWVPGTKVDTHQWHWNRFFSFYSEKAWQPLIDRWGDRVRGNEEQHVPAGFAKAMHGLLKEQAILVRELVFEEVRLRDFPNLPSRRSCTFLCREEYLERWWNTMNGPDARIAQVIATGDAHFGDEQYLRADCIPYDEHCRQAAEYWQGTYGKCAKREEVLFQGEFEVVQIWPSLVCYKGSENSGAHKSTGG